MNTVDIEKSKKTAYSITDFITGHHTLLNELAHLNHELEYIIAFENKNADTSSFFTELPMVFTSGQEIKIGFDTYKLAVKYAIALTQQKIEASNRAIEAMSQLIVGGNDGN